MTGVSTRLQWALKGNALFSLTSGLGMTVYAAALGEWMGVPALALRVIGPGLIIFAADLLWMSRQPGRALRWGRVASVADFGWVAASIVLLSVWPHALTPGGRVLVAVVAGAVALFGAAQWSGWRKLEAQAPGLDTEGLSV